MSIEGRIAIDVSFADSAEGTSVQSLKKIALVDTQAYTTGKVASVTDTTGTAVTTIQIAPSQYLDASGTAVSIVTVGRFVFACSRAATVRFQNGPIIAAVVGSDGNRAAVGELVLGAESPAVTVVPYFTAGTASYTLVLYGT